MSDQESSVKLKTGRSNLFKAHIKMEEYIKEITNCQSEINLLYEKQSEEQQKKSQQFEDLKKPHINRRTELIKTIPNFWVNAIEKHPKLCLLLDDEVNKVLRYMTKIVTDDAAEYKNGVGYKINFLFEENPFIENSILTKEISLLQVEGEMEIRSSSTTIIWKSNREGFRVNNGGTSNGKDKNFFLWFCDNENPYEDDNFSYFQAISEAPFAYSPLFLDSSEEEIEESNNRRGAGDHASRVLKQVEDLNLND